MPGVAGAEKGIHISCLIEPTRGLKRCVATLPPDAGRAIEVQTAHITAMYGYEIPATTPESGVGETALGEAYEEIVEHVALAGLEGSLLFQRGDKLRPFKRWTGIPIEPNVELMDARNGAARICNRRLKTDLPTYRDDYHLSLAVRRDKHKRPPRKTVAFPGGFLVRGYSIDIVDVPYIPDDYKRMSAQQRLSVCRQHGEPLPI